MPQSRVLVLGITFKENCPDVRNTRVVDVIDEMKDYGITVEVFDPWADPDEVRREYGIDVMNECPQSGQYDAIVLAVAHRQFLEMSPESMKALGKAEHIIYDIKSVLPVDLIDARL